MNSSYHRPQVSVYYKFKRYCRKKFSFQIYCMTDEHNKLRNVLILTDSDTNKTCQSIKKTPNQ